MLGYTVNHDPTASRNSGNGVSIVPNTEQRVLEHLKSALRVMVDWRAPAVSLSRKRSSVRFALQSFCRHLERLMKYEESDNYLTDVAEKRPCWQTRVQKLREEHASLRAQMDRLTPQLEDAEEWQMDQFESACLGIRALLDEVERHSHDEIALLQDIMLCDEGGEG